MLRLIKITTKKKVVGEGLKLLNKYCSQFIQYCPRSADGFHDDHRTPAIHDMTNMQDIDSVRHICQMIIELQSFLLLFCSTKKKIIIK